MDTSPNAKKLIFTGQGQKWLSQFDTLDQETAISMASKLTLVSHTEFERNLLKKLEEIASDVGGTIGLFTIRELERCKTDNPFDADLIPFYSQVESKDGKSVNALSPTADQGSEARVAQIIRQFCKSNPKKFLNHPTIDNLRINKADAIIFVDDFIGSGRRIREFLRSFWIEPTIVSWLSGKQICFHVLAYSGTQDGITYVLHDKSKPKIHIYRDAPTFDTIVWSDQKRKEVKDLCEKYGRIANRKRKNMWWGYNTGMAAIIFEHGCPNNTPAIFWEPDFKGSGWVGLFPNRTISSDVASVFPAEIVRGDPVKLLIDAGQIKIAKSGSLLRRGVAGQILLTVLALIAKGQRKRSTISFATGMNVKDCERLIETCIKWDFITVQRRITPKGLAELKAARKVSRQSLISLDKGSDYYYPQKLREASCD